MTDEQLEKASIELCRIRGVNSHGIEYFDGHNSHRAGIPFWKLDALPDIKKHLECAEAIRIVMESY